jgi:hypothetical protein
MDAVVAHEFAEQQPSSVVNVPPSGPARSKEIMDAASAVLRSEERQPLVNEDIPLRFDLPAVELKWAPRWVSWFQAADHGSRRLVQPPSSSIGNARSSGAYHSWASCMVCGSGGRTLRPPYFAGLTAAELEFFSIASGCPMSGERRGLWLAPSQFGHPAGFARHRLRPNRRNRRRDDAVAAGRRHRDDTDRRGVVALPAGRGAG